MAGLFHLIEKKLGERCMSSQDIGIRLLKIEALLVIAPAILVFLGISGSFRRHCRNGAFAMVTLAAYTLTPAVIAYTLGLFQSTPYCSLLFPIWATYLVAVLGNVDSYTAHSMEDIERWKSFRVDSAVKCIMTSWMIATYAILWRNPLVCILFVILFLNVDERARALMLASNSVMQKKCRLIGDYMSTEHQWSNSSDEDPATMRGYRYLVIVAGEAKVHSSCSKAKWRRKAAPWLDGDAPHYRQLLEVTDEVITVEKVWNCKGRLLSVSGGDRDGRLKDLCLSFSLFKFICLRFTGYSLPREAHNKLWRLIQHMLSEENGYERVFRVIEVELAFLFDLFYTKYPVNLHCRPSVYKLLLFPIVVAVPLILLYAAILEQDVFAIIAIVLLLMSILVVKLTQFGIMIFSEWAKVTYICKYVRSEWWRRNKCAGKLIEIICRVWLVKPWGRQLRQYSLLKSYSYSPRKCIYNRLTAAYLDQKRDGQKQIAPTNLSTEVKKAIAQSLEKYLEKGQASLRLNDLSDVLSWACNLETATHVIMVWHIATTFCEHEVPRAQLSQEQRDDFDVATELSQYLAYLVAFAPRLLPGHPCRTEYIFGRAVSEARELVGGSLVSMEERIQKLKKVIDNEQYQETSVGRGARLGMQLVNVVAGEGQIWKVLADFWADMLLYVAPSNDTAAHGKYLTTGGEFVTHIWVLVSHAGITRDPRDGEEHDDPERN
ncbi:uncharacterized protein LOC115663033 [Syzygium oleosum]|uniref:uncharacterized protein LOC115663033 n=1 Tax=Syzygium oleosum TaxID=219896 RepID=UPI0024B9344D|nr:uncharacterized protein LOC115663033 [Syzygium oleosum]XP_056175745.1 uncharacterized protein LOC115663033 [Syzygium oleosum]